MYQQTQAQDYPPPPYTEHAYGQPPSAPAAQYNPTNHGYPTSSYASAPQPSHYTQQSTSLPTQHAPHASQSSFYPPPSMHHGSHLAPQHSHPGSQSFGNLPGMLPGHGPGYPPPTSQYPPSPAPTVQTQGYGASLTPPGAFQPPYGQGNGQKTPAWGTPSHSPIPAPAHSPLQPSVPNHSLPDMQKLGLHGGSNNGSGPLPPAPRRTTHAARCSACGASPIRGIRWHCTQCADEDLCDACRRAGKQASHAFRQLDAGVERHAAGVFCDGCGASPIYGARFACTRHGDEDFCEECVRVGNLGGGGGGSSGRLLPKRKKLCEGPFREVRQTPLGARIERDACVPLPREWLPPGGLLPAVVAPTYHLVATNSVGWLELPDALRWMPLPERARAELAPADAAKVAAAAFTADITNKGGHFRDRVHAWTLREGVAGKPGGGGGRRLWSYRLETDRKTGTTVLSEYFGKPSSPSGGSSSSSCCSSSGMGWEDADNPLPRFEFQHGPKCDSLVFSTPARADGSSGAQHFRWLTNGPISTVGGNRWDAQRYALLRREPDGRTERLVADYAVWDGHPERPEDCFCVRSASLDRGLALATLTALLARQWKCLERERAERPAEVEDAVERARLTPLGRLAYWTAGDRRRKGGSSAETLEAVGGIFDVLDAAGTIMGAADGGGGGGDGGGGAVGDGGGGGGGA